MIALLPWLLRAAGAGLILLALVHVPMARHLKWREDSARLSPTNAAIFQVHAFFICVMLVMIGLPSLLDPSVFIEHARAAAWETWSFAGLWVLRLYCQWFAYRRELWQGKHLETALHWWFTFVWLGLALLYGLCGAVQLGWLLGPAAV